MLRTVGAVVKVSSYASILTYAHFRSLHFSRCGQPAQQQGRRFPSLSSVYTLFIRLCLVSGFLASSIQQIHSLRASGVISSQFDSATLSEMRAFRKSSGTQCTTPLETSFLTIVLLCQHFYRKTKLFSSFRDNGQFHRARRSTRDPVLTEVRFFSNNHRT
jgi:hypothetical protein